MRKSISALFLLLLFLLTGCRKTDIGPETETTEAPETSETTLSEQETESIPETEPPSTFTYSTVYRSDREYRSTELVLPPRSEMASTNGRYYCFHPTIPEGSRDDFIHDQETLIALLEENGIPCNLITVGVIKSYTGWASTEKSVIYMGIEEAKSWKQVLYTLQVAMGEFTNYGYLYALSNAIAGSLGWTTDEIPSVDTEELKKSPYIMDLTYPCFEGGYVPESETNLAKAVATAILESCEDPYDAEQFRQKQLDYALSAGIEDELAYLEFASAGDSCPLRIRNQYYELLVFREYDPKAEDVAYFADYPTLVSYLERFDRNIAYAAQYFDVTDAPVIEARLSPTIMEEYSETVIGVFLSNNGNPFIKMENLDCLVHEYVHYLYYTYCTENGWDSGAEVWQNEALAYYFGITGNAVLYETYYRSPSLFAYQFTQFVGHPYEDDWDSMYLLHTAAVESDTDPIEALYEYDHECGSLAAYVTQRFGEDVMAEVMLHPSRAEELTGCTMEDILQDWKALVLEARGSAKCYDEFFPKR